MKIFDVCSATGTYQAEGVEKTRWIRVGAVFKNENGNVSIKLDSIPTKLNQEGEMWLNCFTPQNQQQTQAAPAARQPVTQGFRDQPPSQQPRTAAAAPQEQPIVTGFGGAEDETIPF